MKHEDWEIEEIYPEGDFQCRIMRRGCMSGGQYLKPRDQIIVGEHCKQGGQANIHDKSIASLIVASPDLLEVCKGVLDFMEHRKSDLKHLGEALIHKDRIAKAIAKAENK